jgi:hypothetical protein
VVTTTAAVDITALPAVSLADAPAGTVAVPAPAVVVAELRAVAGHVGRWNATEGEGGMVATDQHEDRLSAKDG